MQSNTRAKLLRATAVVLLATAALLAGFGFMLIKDGAYPAEGTGSLGHVGMMIAGAIAVFLALICALFALLCKSKMKSTAGTDIRHGESSRG